MPSAEVSPTLLVASHAVVAGLRRGMTRHAGAHLVHDLPGHHVALPHRSVAGLACDAGCRVAAVAEIDVGRELVDADPENRLLRFGGGGQLLDVRTVGLDQPVTAHAEALRGEAHELTRVR